MPRTRSLSRILGLAALAVGTLLALPPSGASARRFDLDVSIAPGAGTDWGRAFPAYTPSRDPLFPRSPRAGRAAEVDPNRSTSRPRTAELDVRLGSSFGLVRILTWDLMAHLSWIEGRYDNQPLSGRSSRDPALPRPGKAMYWIGFAPLLRLLLHPQLVSEAGTIAHLVEVGEPVLGALSTAERESKLRSVAAELRSSIQVGRGRLEPLEAESAQGRMWARFVFEELLAAHPYDPEASFGARLFVFGDELLPYVLGYTRAEDAFLRRNAVAALTRYRERDAALALVDLALNTDDDVVYARALAGLGRGFGPGGGAALTSRLRPSDEPWQQVAVIAALGRMGASDAAPELVRVGQRERRDDTDILMAVIEALARMRRHEARLSVVDFAERVHDSARQRPGSYDVQRPNPDEMPDRADPRDGRGQLIAQLALCLRLALDPLDERWSEELLALVGEPQAEGGRFRPRQVSASLGAVHARAQPLVLDILSRLGERGNEALLRVARDATVEPAVRGLALSLATITERDALALRMIEEDVEDEEMLIQALEVLHADSHPRLIELCERRVRGGGQIPPARPRAVQRHLALRAVQILGERDALSLARLRPLLPLLDAPQVARMADTELVRDAIEELVEAHVERVSARERRRMIDELAALAQELALADHLSSMRESEIVERIGLHLRSLNAGSNTQFQTNVSLALFAFLCGNVQHQPFSNGTEFEPPVQLEEELCLALGRTRTPEASLVLRELLDNREHAYRAWACLGLGVSGDREQSSALVPFLMDEEPFVRLCAWRALKHLTGQDFFADWLYGDRLTYARAAEQYFAWIALDD